MIPPLLIVGFVLGLWVGQRFGATLAVVGCLALSALWGIGIGATNDDALIGVGAAGLAAANVVVGLIVGGVTQWAIVRAATPRP